jgi:hypothetical protein
MAIAFAVVGLGLAWKAGVVWMTASNVQISEPMASVSDNLSLHLGSTQVAMSKASVLNTEAARWTGPRRYLVPLAPFSVFFDNQTSWRSQRRRTRSSASWFLGTGVRFDNWQRCPVPLVFQMLRHGQEIGGKIRNLGKELPVLTAVLWPIGFLLDFRRHYYIIR